ncbi:hypothetical protein EVAR_76255_1 [Eumeta japonica]|uniref:Uncharacterized protein n=1 Tax=Eumeta variegata TaxID=151549 RepID=A0A4C1UPL9_EUMVA|nr:hypothetical protein EVAR_76255_1 [Eumeta japonica]
MQTRPHCAAKIVTANTLGYISSVQSTAEGVITAYYGTTRKIYKNGLFRRNGYPERSRSRADGVDLIRFRARLQRLADHTALPAVIFYQRYVDARSGLWRSATRTRLNERRLPETLVISNALLIWLNFKQQDEHVSTKASAVRASLRLISTISDYYQSDALGIQTWRKLDQSID